VGWNEAITGTFTGMILRLDGSVPLKFGENKYLYIFGSSNMKLGRNINQEIPPFFLVPNPDGMLTDSNTVIVPVDRYRYLQSNRDTFRIGVGVDLMRIFDKDE
jgi:hypothetical protein